MNTNIIEEIETIETTETIKKIENVTYYDIIEVECTDITTRIYQYKRKNSEKIWTVVEYTLYFMDNNGIAYKNVTTVYPYRYYSPYRIGATHVISYGTCHYTDDDTYHHLEDVRQVCRDDMLLLHRLREESGYGLGQKVA